MQITKTAETSRYHYINSKMRKHKLTSLNDDENKDKEKIKTQQKIIKLYVTRKYKLRENMEKAYILV